jgi:3-oxoacyl-[acyl-carrier protein] reductase
LLDDRQRQPQEVTLAMADRYTEVTNSMFGRLVAENIGLPVPTPLERYSPGDPVARGPVLLGGAAGGRLLGPAAQVLADVGAEVSSALDDDVRRALAAADVEADVFNPEAPEEDARFNALVFDATGIGASEDLRALREFFSPTVRRLEASGRLIVLGTPPEECGDVREATAQRAIEGFTRSAGKEIRHGSTAQLVLVSPGSEDQIASTLRFLLSARSAFVSGQVVHVRAPDHADEARATDWERPLAGKSALVTGASRGIGAAIAEVLARDGAQVVGLDVPQAEEPLRELMDKLGGSVLVEDITDADAPQKIASYMEGEHGGADLLVNNAGITRDKTLGRMDADRWDSVIGVNLTAAERITAALTERDDAGLKRGGRVVCLSSMNGIAGQGGQTNYATSKAGLIGMTRAWAPVMAKRSATINAVAPGFIETKMTADMPLFTREAGRRLNSLSQGGLPVDVAETIAWFCSPASGAINGNVIRVCGQALLGA